MSSGARTRVNARAVLVAGWSSALVASAAVLAIVALAGQATALAVGALGGPGSASVTPTLGWLYSCLFLHVPIRLEAAATTATAVANGAGAEGTVAAALLTGTLGAAALLWSGGRRVAERARGDALARAFHGAKVAPGFALGVFAISTFVRVRVPLPPNPFIGDVTIRPTAIGSLAWPLAIAAAAGAGGGWWSSRQAGTPSPASRAPRRSEVAAVVGGATRMLAVGLGGCLVAIVILAAIQPDAAAAYGRSLARAGPGAATIEVAHEALAAPNVAVWVLAAAMGGCDGVYGSGVSVDALCLDRVPSSIGVDLFTPESGPPPSISDAPAALLALLIVPAAATVIGGLHAARRLRTPTTLSSALVGTAAGVIFAALAGLAAFLAGVHLSGELFNGAATGIVTYGPSASRTATVGLAWGICGGALGGLLARAAEARAFRRR